MLSKDGFEHGIPDISNSSCYRTLVGVESCGVAIFTNHRRGRTQCVDTFQDERDNFLGNRTAHIH